MKKLYFVFLIFVTIAGLLNAQVETVNEAPFLPVSPRVMAQGGSFIAAANGYDALFYNPAGFARTTFSLTLSSISSWLYANPAVMQEVMNTFLSDSSSDQGTSTENALSAMTILNEQLSTGGVGMGLSTGAGLVAGGLGIGGALVFDTSLYGRRGLLDLSGDITATLGVVAGYAVAFDALGMKWNVGADIRPMYRIHSILENQEAIAIASEFINGNMDTALELLQANAALTGMGVGIDVGTIVELGNLNFALSIKDLFGTKFDYYNNAIPDILDALSNNESIPQDEANKVTDTNYVIPMDISAGAALNIDILKPLMGLVVHGDLQDVIGVIRDGRSPWTLLHIGAEATFLEILKLRAGFNQGYITMGAGLHLLFLDVNAALFTRELGVHIKDRPNSGATVEVAVRL